MGRGYDWPLEETSSHVEILNRLDVGIRACACCKRAQL